MSYYAGKNVLVPGGAGFIGTHLVAELLAAGARVTVVDDLSTGSLANVNRFARNKAFKFIERDIVRYFNAPADVVFNLACPASPVHYQRDPIQTWRSSVLGVNNLLELCLDSGARLIQASTSEIYGDPLIHPQREDYWGNVNPNGPRSCYDEGKRAAETLILDFHRKLGVDVRIARIFNTYGPLMAVGDGRVVSNLVVQALENRDLTIYGDGQQTRSFCFVSDMVKGLLRLGEVAEAAGQVVNLGNPFEVSMNDLAQHILRQSESGSSLVRLCLPQDDPVRRLPDIGKARSLLGWQPEISLENGLAETIAYFSSIVQSAAYPLDALSARA